MTKTEEILKDKTNREEVIKEIMKWFSGRKNGLIKMTKAEYET